MKNIHYIRTSVLVIFLSFFGHVANSSADSLFGTIDKGLSAVEGAAQSGKQVIDAGAAATNAAGAGQIGLVDTLVNQLGVSQQQALGGAGAVFQMAQGNMSPQAFATLSQSTPGMDSMLNAAPVMPESVSGLTGSLSSMMGNANNTLGSAAALAASFQQLNLSPDMVGQFIPVITNYVRQTSGRVTADLLQSALGVR